MTFKSENAIRYLNLILGSVSMAAGIVFFLTQGKIAAGGASGIAIMTNHLTGIGPGLIMALVNAPLMILGLKAFGRDFLLHTLAFILMTSMASDLFYYLCPEISITEDRLLSAVVGGVLTGIGVGLAFRSSAAPGGWGILARVLADRFHIAVGRMMFGLDCLIVALSALAFMELETTLYGAISIFVTGKMIDLIVTGRPNVKSVHISCHDVSQLLPQIQKNLCSPGALLHCDRIDQPGKRDVMFMTVKRDQIPLLRKTVQEHESDAIMIVFDAIELYGSSAQPQPT
ncbi:YitT family protein [Pseudomaricurvus alkylphenolicus]|uniref:YitT family protein n=1 Tax=Pseudomaricurvus alkylphenolicus TaxID=1306991 RepID=UPI001423BD17|nr:YitT family protein [Pseudomaricurvus alkylphenolicus]NIB38283.1 YitT family protein [Pseudomaricurvus alkylphenolicus]